MFVVFFSLLVVLALLSICGEFIMRSRVTKRASHDKIAWWRRGGDEVAGTYEQLFPNSHLPSFRRIVFWLVIAFGVSTLLAVLWKSK